ncbi:MAG: alpha-amylase family protein [Saccharofermentanales bacterium]
MDIIDRLPDSVQIAADSNWEFLVRQDDVFTNGKVKIVLVAKDGLEICVRAKGFPISYIKLRWNFDIPSGVKIMGDALERSYGDLEWRGMNADRYLYWYALVYCGNRTFGYGVKVQPSSIAFWQIDGRGVTLWLNVRCGGMPLELDDKVLKAATVVSAKSSDCENTFAFGKRFCKIMSPDSLKVPYPVYGSNNWYYAYGISSHEQILKDTEFLTGLTRNNENKPFMIIDAGWQEAANVTDTCAGGQGLPATNFNPCAGGQGLPATNFNPCAGGPWTKGNGQFPDMERLAKEISSQGAKPGIWARFIKTHDEALPDSMMIKREGGGRLLDPSVPEALEYIKNDVRRICKWGYKLIKHDFSSFDIFGKYGMQMDFTITDGGWSFHDKSKTTAEVIKDFYSAVLEAAGDTMILGCNCVGHLGAGLMHLQRTGDDTSGYRWDRTRKMGVNTLAYRLIQHKAFFEIDADCLGIMKVECPGVMKDDGPGNMNRIPWEMNKKWLDILSKSGTPLFVSVDPDAVTSEQKDDLKKALERASIQKDICEPIDWHDTTTPSKWLINGDEEEYNWFTEEGIYDFGILA